MDWNDEALVTKLRMGYFLEQFLLAILCGLLFIKVTAVPDTKTIYHKKEKSIGDPSPRWIKTTYAKVEYGEVSALVMQMGMGLLMTCVMHFYFGVKQSMLMQAVMQPVAFLECPVVKKHFLKVFKPGDRAYGEKFEGEDLPLEDGDQAGDDDQQDGAKAAAVAAASGSDSSAAGGGGGDDEDEMPVAETSEQAVSRLIGETWDSGKNADYAPLFEALEEDGTSGELVDVQSDSEATALMVVAAGVGDVGRHVQRLLLMGADVNVKDDEGWTALHWAAFHGNLSGVTALVEGCRSQGGGVLAQLLATTDDEGCTCIDLARKELEGAGDELDALKVELSSDNPLSAAQLASKETQVSTKKKILDVLETAAGSAGASASPADDDEDLQEID